MRNTRVKIAVAVAKEDVAGWPGINWPYEKELKRIMDVVRSMNTDIDFTLTYYTDKSEAEADYEEDLKKYDGVLVLVMTCWTGVELFYAQQAAEGIPTIVADIPFYGSGSVLMKLSPMLREKKYPVPLLATTDYREIGQVVRCFDVIHKMKEVRILVISDRDVSNRQVGFDKQWGCEFINCTAEELNRLYEKADSSEAEKVADRWIEEAVHVVEPTRDEIVKSARLHIAIRDMMAAHNCQAVTLDCLSISYANKYLNGQKMYPCLSHYEMLKNGTVAVCEADPHSTVSSLLTLYLTGRQGFVSDPVVDTSCDQITYAHCVACTKIFGCKDARTCSFNIRSHAEDLQGASVQVNFPAGEKLTTIQTFSDGTASIHSAVSLGNNTREEGCRSKLLAKANAEKLLENWSPNWHHVTVFGDYRKLFGYLYKMKGIRVIEEDK